VIQILLPSCRGCSIYDRRQKQQLKAATKLSSFALCT
jgi:hypothetical protein